MLRKDYILRLAEEFGKFLGVLFGLKHAGKWEELEMLINSAAKKYSNIEIELAESFANENFIEILGKQYNLSTENFKMLGDLLYEKGLFYTKVGKETEAKNAFVKTLFLYRAVQLNSLDSDFSLDMHYKMASLEQLLGLKE